MVDFQYSRLDVDVYRLIATMCDLVCSNDFPHFITNELENEQWQCSLSIPELNKKAVAIGNTEVEAINRCATNMLFILDKNLNNPDEFDPDDEDTLIFNNVEGYFGDKDLNNLYKYHMYETDILLDTNNESILELLKSKADDVIKHIDRSEEEFDQISEIVTIRVLARTKKDYYC